MRALAVGAVIVSAAAVLLGFATLQMHEQHQEHAEAYAATQAEAMRRFIETLEQVEARAESEREWLARDIESCHRRVELVKWLAKQVAKTQRGRERLPSPPYPWPSRPGVE